jgi:phosphatidylserine decarboxylase
VTRGGAHHRRLAAVLETAGNARADLADGAGLGGAVAVGAAAAPVEGWAAVGLLGIAGYFVSVWLLLPILLLIIYTISFFRDPERVAPADPDAVLAAADGKVADIVEIEETEVLNARTRRVGIFLSVFDVHTNRAPIDGSITYREHRAGLCLDARSPECSNKNEAMTWAFQNPRATLVVRQLTGAIARRIVAWSKVSDVLQKGERFGMIRFGSRTEIYLPLDATVLVNVGDRVSGGATVIARLP